MECLRRLTYICCFGTPRPQVEPDIAIRVDTTATSTVDPPTEVVDCQPSPLPPERRTFYFIRHNLATSEVEVFGIPAYQMELLEQLV